LREGKWDNWLENIQEYDIEIKPLSCHQFSGRMNKVAMPLQPIVMVQPFY
jgi:hypothetical protein